MAWKENVLVSNELVLCGYSAKYSTSTVEYKEDPERVVHETSACFAVNRFFLVRTV